MNTRPDYYEGEIECWDAIKSAVSGKKGFQGFLVGNIIKYLWRYEEKGGYEDICKAEEYLKKLKKTYITQEEKKVSVWLGNSLSLMAREGCEAEDE